MSLYNLVHGMNSNIAVTLSGIVGYRIDERFPRFRNIFTEAEDAPENLKSADFYVYTRMGGGNYNCWEDKYTPDCDCPAHKVYALEKEPWCLGGWDDDFDCTYRTFAIKLTEAQKAEFDGMLANGISDDLFERILSLHPKLKEMVENAGKVEAP
jgi:hypothetical protein